MLSTLMTLEDCFCVKVATVVAIHGGDQPHPNTRLFVLSQCLFDIQAYGVPLIPCEFFVRDAGGLAGSS